MINSSIRSRIVLSVVFSSLIVDATSTALKSRGAEERNDSGVVVMDDFSRGADAWKPTDPTAWKVIQTDRGPAYSLTKLSKYKPPHRSPLGMSLLKDVVMSDFTLRVDAQSTIKGSCPLYAQGIAA